MVFEGKTLEYELRCECGDVALGEEDALRRMRRGKMKLYAAGSLTVFVWFAYLWSAWYVGTLPPTHK